MLEDWIMTACAGNSHSAVKEARYVEDGPWWEAKISDPDLTSLSDIRSVDERG